jgi:hypothetical protein
MLQQFLYDENTCPVNLLNMMIILIIFRTRLSSPSYNLEWQEIQMQMRKRYISH